MFQPSLFWWSLRRRRTFSALVIVLMTLALVTRAMAGPVIHLHDAMERVVPAADVSRPEPVQGHGASNMDGAIVDRQAASTAPHSHSADSPVASHAKACDSNGACCGPLALSDSSHTVVAPLPVPEPVALPLSAGVRPASPDRPPSPLLA